MNEPAVSFRRDVVNANGSASVALSRLEGRAFAEAFGESLPNVRIHSQKSMLGQHGAGSSALQAVGACLTLRRSVVPPTINHDDPDPACGNLRVVTSAETGPARRVLVHSIGLGGFYYSAAAFEASSRATGRKTGNKQVRWSDTTVRIPSCGGVQPAAHAWEPRQDT